MECNKDEAARSKGIAEAKFLEHDFVGARKFAFKARQLFPELDGLPQFISVLDVHIIAQEKLHGGETNWYGVLQVDPTADESTIRKQYRKLALLLHPDKNKSAGAEAAFKHISEAWGVLSDKAKKAVHDMKRNARAAQSSKVAQNKEPAPTSNGYHNIIRPTTTHPQPQPPPPPPSQPPPDVRTFWTACSSCRMQFEYERLYENKNLCCPVCYKPFLAREVPVSSGTTIWPPQQQQGSRKDAKRQGHQGNGFANGVKSSTFVNGSVPGPPCGNVAAAHVVHPQMKERARKEHKGVQEQKNVRKNEQKKRKEQNKSKVAEQAKEAFDRLIARSKGVIEQKLSSDKASASERKVAADKTSVLGSVWPEQSPVSGQLNTDGQKRTSETAIPVKVATSSNGNNEGKENRAAQEYEDTDKLGTPSSVTSKLGTRKSPRGKRNAPTRLDYEVQDEIFLAKKARVEQCSDEQVLKGETLKEFQDFKSADSERMGNNEVNGVRYAAGETESSKLAKDAGENATFTAGVHTLQGDSPLHVPRAGEIGLNSMPEAADAMNVPDADFYDFDKDRTEYHFSLGQIWAAYDDDDGMPRYYARIGKVISQKPFKIQMSWLEARSPSDETIAWLSSGFSYTCGEFKLGMTISSEHINTFSHLVSFEKGQRGGFKLYPRKGDVWALYKDWNIVKTQGAKHGYEMVEVLTDFKDEVGVQIAFLAKIEGFKTLFKRQLGEQDVQWISLKELRRFSHQVPAHSPTAEQVLGIQEGCWELDPASTPMNLITGKQV